MLLDSTWRNISVCKLLLSPRHTLFCLYHDAIKHSVTVQFLKLRPASHFSPASLFLIFVANGTQFI